MFRHSHSAWNATLGHEADDCRGKSVGSLLSSCDQCTNIDQVIANLPPGAACVEFEAQTSAPGDAKTTLHVSVSGCHCGARRLYLWQVSVYTCHEYFKTRALHLEQVLEQSGDSVIVKDLNAVVTYWNREATKIYGFSTQEATGRTIRELHAANDTGEQYQQLLARIRSGNGTSSTAERRKKNGDLVWVSCKTTFLRAWSLLWTAR